MSFEKIARWIILRPENIQLVEYETTHIFHVYFDIPEGTKRRNIIPRAMFPIDFTFRELSPAYWLKLSFIVKYKLNTLNDLEVAWSVGKRMSGATESSAAYCDEHYRLTTYGLYGQPTIALSTAYRDN